MLHVVYCVARLSTVQLSAFRKMLKLTNCQAAYCENRIHNMLWTHCGSNEVTSIGDTFHNLSFALGMAA